MKPGMEHINKHLENLGKDLDGKPLWRVVWAEEQTEYRFGTFRDFYNNSDILIREVTESRLVKKYPWIGPRWILERWIPPEMAYTPEVPASQLGDFMCVFVFEDAKGNPLPVTETVCRHLIRRAEASQSEARTEKQLTDEQKALERKEVLALAEMLGYDGPEDAPFGEELKDLNLKTDTSQFLRS